MHVQAAMESTKGFLRTTRCACDPFCRSIHEDHTWRVLHWLHSRQSLCCAQKLIKYETSPHLYRNKDKWLKTAMLFPWIHVLWLTNLVEDVIDIGCSFSRGFHEEKTVLLSICLSFLKTASIIIHKQCLIIYMRVCNKMIAVGWLKEFHLVDTGGSGNGYHPHMVYLTHNLIFD